MTGERPLTVDIVVNNYNYGRFVGEAVDSACRQDHPAVNVIVVDDGSTDDSRERLERYRDRVDLVLKENGGQASALNAGFARCRGDVVLFLDADDVLHPSAASLAATALLADAGASRVQFQWRLIDADGVPLPQTDSGSHVRGGDLRRDELRFPFDTTSAPTSCNAFRVSLLRQIMPIPELAYGLCADYYLVHLSTLLGTVVAPDAVGACYRVHGSNGFQPAASVLDLDRVRREIQYQDVTMRALTQLADELGLERPGRLVSTSNVALRVISRKLAPSSHPIAHDRLLALMAEAVQAASRRYSVSRPMRLLLLLTVWTIAVAPARLAQRLAEMLLFPDSRPGWARVSRDRAPGHPGTTTRQAV